MLPAPLEESLSPGVLSHRWRTWGVRVPATRARPALKATTSWQPLVLKRKTRGHTSSLCEHAESVFAHASPCALGVLDANAACSTPGCVPVQSQHSRLWCCLTCATLSCSSHKSTHPNAQKLSTGGAAALHTMAQVFRWVASDKSYVVEGSAVSCVLCKVTPQPLRRVLRRLMAPQAPPLRRSEDGLPAVNGVLERLIDDATTSVLALLDLSSLAAVRATCTGWHTAVTQFANQAVHTGTHLLWTSRSQAMRYKSVPAPWALMLLHAIDDPGTELLRIIPRWCSGLRRLSVVFVDGALLACLGALASSLTHLSIHMIVSARSTPSASADITCACLRELRIMRELRELHVRISNEAVNAAVLDFDDYGLEVRPVLFDFLHELPMLETLVLRHIDAYDHTVTLHPSELASLARCTKLVRIDLGWKELDHEGAFHEQALATMRAMATNPTLKHTIEDLALPNVVLDDPLDTPTLTCLLEFEGLRTLSLQWSPTCGRFAWEHLAKLQSLRRFSLGIWDTDQPSSAECTRIFDTLGRCEQLETLELQDWSTLPHHLATLPATYHRFRELTLIDCNTSGDDAKQALRCMEHLEILRVVERTGSPLDTLLSLPRRMPRLCRLQLDISFRDLSVLNRHDGDHNNEMMADAFETAQGSYDDQYAAVCHRVLMSAPHLRKIESQWC